MSEAIQIVWRKRFDLIQALIAPGLALACLETAYNRQLIAQSSWLWMTLYFVASGIIFTLFAVSCHRIILLDGAAVPRYGIHSWSPREMRFLGWTFVGYFYFVTITMIVGLFGGLVSIGAPTDQIYSNFWVVVILPGAYVFARLAVLLPATAIDERHDMKWAWDITSNNGWRLVMVVALLPGLLAVTASYIGTNRLIVEFLVNLLSYALAAIEIALLSVSFRFLNQASGGIDETNSTLRTAAASDDTHEENR